MLLEQAKSFFQLNTNADILRVLKIPALLSLEAGKYVLMVYCGCETDELNNWMSQAMRTPYYWRTRPGLAPFVAGPYSPIWYLVNQPARLGYFPWMNYLFVLDVVFSAFNLFKHGWKWTIWYSANSIYFYNNNPIDFFLFNICCLGLYSLKWSGFAVLFKIPWITLPFVTPTWFPFPPSYVWPFVLNDPYGFHESPGRYVQLALVFIVPVIILFYWKHTNNAKYPPLDSGG